MKVLPTPKFQIGKRGITEGFTQSIALAFKIHREVKISVLKSAGPDRDKIKEIAAELEKEMPRTKTKIIGFTIILRRSRYKGTIQ